MTPSLKWIEYLAIAVWLAFAPIHTALECCIVLPVVDLVLALIVAIKAKQPIQSSGLKRTVGKMAMYLAGLLLAFATETWLTGPLVPCVHVVTGLIGMTELKSCLEHLDALNGAPVFSSIMAKIVPYSYSYDSNDSDPKNPMGD